MKGSLCFPNWPHATLCGVCFVSVSVELRCLPMEQKLTSTAEGEVWEAKSSHHRKCSTHKGLKHSAQKTKTETKILIFGKRKYSNLQEEHCQCMTDWKIALSKTQLHKCG